MESGAKSILRTGILFIIGGMVSVIGGILSMVVFFKEPTGADLNVLTIIRGVVLPHLFIFLGVGVLVYGIILIVKIVIINKRKKISLCNFEPSSSKFRVQGYTDKRH